MISYGIKCPRCGHTLTPPLDPDEPDMWWCGDCDWEGKPLLAGPVGDSP